MKCSLFVSAAICTTVLGSEAEAGVRRTYAWAGWAHHYGRGAYLVEPAGLRYNCHRSTPSCDEFRAGDGMASNRSWFAIGGQTADLGAELRVGRVATESKFDGRWLWRLGATWQLYDTKLGRGGPWVEIGLDHVGSSDTNVEYSGFSYGVAFRHTYRPWHYVAVYAEGSLDAVGSDGWASEAGGNGTFTKRNARLGMLRFSLGVMGEIEFF